MPPPAISTRNRPLTAANSDMRFLHGADSAAGHRPGADSDPMAPLARWPCVKPEARETLQLRRVRYLLSDACDDHAPAASRLWIDAVDLERRPGGARQAVELRSGRRAEGDRLRA